MLPTASFIEKMVSMSNPILVGNAPCSWGSLEFEGLSGEPIRYGQMLDELVASGYTGTELGDWGFMPTDTEQLRATLAERKLTMTGAFVPVALRDPNAHAEGVERVLTVARQLAAVASPENPPFLVLADNNGSDPVRTKQAGRIGPELNLTPEQWRIFADGANQIARAVREQTGLRTVFHHHCAGDVETPNEIATLLELTDPELLGLVFDTGHYLYGSGQNDPAVVMEALERHADRIWYVHFKDCQPEIAEQARREEWDYFTAVANGVFCELGKGSVDFAAVTNWLREHEYRGFITVEQDVLPGMGAPRLSAERNRAFLRTIGL